MDNIKTGQRYKWPEPGKEVIIEIDNIILKEQSATGKHQFGVRCFQIIGKNTGWTQYAYHIVESIDGWELMPNQHKAEYEMKYIVPSGTSLKPVVVITE
jgi:hypothetical protein